MKRVFFILSILIVFNSLAQSKYPPIQSALKSNLRKPIFFKDNARINGNGYQQTLSNNTTDLLDSVTYWVYDTITNSWNQPYYKTSDYVYSVNHNIISDTNQGWTGSKWQTDDVENYIYDINNNLLSHTYSTWNGNSFFASYAETYTYNANNDSTDFILQTWKINALTNNLKTSYGYDSNHHLTSDLYQHWDTTNAWVSTNSIIYTYTGNNITCIFHQSLVAGANSYKDTNFTYNANNQITGFTTQGSGLNTFTYDANGNLVRHLQSGSIQELYTYDVNNNLLSHLYQYWNGHDWTNELEFDYTYDTNNNLTSDISKAYNYNNTNQTLQYGTRYYYKNQLPLANNLLNMYPNPNNGVFVIETNATTTQNIQVYDINGRAVFNQQIPANPYPFVDVNSTTVVLNSLSSGVYNISFTSNAGVVNKRLVIVR
jgi:YD repeat-containing protein